MRKILLPPVMLALCLLAIILLNRYQLAGPQILPERLTPIGYALMVIGLILPTWGARLFHRHDTNLVPYKSPDKLIIAGPFKRSRNPMYLGLLLVLIGLAIKQGTAMSFAMPLIFFAVANWWYIPFEEEKMARAFGEDFTAYKKRVRRWL